MPSIPTSDDLKTLFEEGKLASAMSRRFDISDTSDLETIEARCAALHNSGQIDVLRLIETGEVQALQNHRFFSASHFICQLIPELVDTSTRMMTGVEALVARGANDGAANFPNAAFRSWCEKNQGRAQEIVASACQDDPLASRHLTFALEALNNADEARVIARSFADERRLRAITALGRMHNQDAASIRRTLSLFDGFVDAGADDLLYANMLVATASLLPLGDESVSTDATALVLRLVERAGPQTLHQAAQILWAHTKDLNREIVAGALTALARISSTNKGTVHEIDMGLSALLNTGYAQEAIDFVAQQFGEGQGPDLGELKSFASALASGPPEHLSRLIVRSLILGAPRLCSGLSAIVPGDDLAGPILNLAPSDLALPSGMLMLAARRAIGWYFFRPRSAASILVSILRVCDDETAISVQQLLANLLLANYGGVRHFLADLDQNDSARARVDVSVAQNEAYLNALNTVGSIKELAPSEMQRRIERLRMQDEMRTAHKKAQSQSVFLSMIKRSVMLYGSRSLTFVDDGNGTPRPIQTNLSSFGVSMEHPRMDLVDPIGLQLILLQMKLGRAPG